MRLRRPHPREVSLSSTWSRRGRCLARPPPGARPRGNTRVMRRRSATAVFLTCAATPRVARSQHCQYLALPAYACAASLRCAARPILCTASLYPAPPAILCAAIAGYPLRRHSLRCAANLSCASSAYLPPSQLAGEGARLAFPRARCLHAAHHEVQRGEQAGGG